MTSRLPRPPTLPATLAGIAPAQNGWDLLLALGTVLSMATQLRPGGLPVGPGEICLAGWLAINFPRAIAQSDALGSPAFSRLATFWLILICAESIGTLAGLFIGDRHDAGLMLHDVLAYMLLIPMSCLLVVGPDAAARLYRLAWLHGVGRRNPPDCAITERVTSCPSPASIPGTGTGCVAGPRTRINSPFSASS